MVYAISIFEKRGNCFKEQCGDNRFERHHTKASEIDGQTHWKKVAVLNKSMEILNSKPGERTEANEDVFGKTVAGTLKRMSP